jgi:hypothetical protein
MSTLERVFTRTGTVVPESNRTVLGLFVSPHEAYEMWKANADRVQCLDVRTFEEYVSGGHIAWAKNVPLVRPVYDATLPPMPGKPPGSTGEPNPPSSGQCRRHTAQTTWSCACAPRVDAA